MDIKQLYEEVIYIKVTHVGVFNSYPPTEFHLWVWRTNEEYYIIESGTYHWHYHWQGETLSDVH